MAIADAYVDLHVNGDSVDTEVRETLRDAGPSADKEADRVGRSAGRSMGKSMSKALTASIKPTMFLGLGIAAAGSIPQILSLTQSLLPLAGVLGPMAGAGAAAGAGMVTLAVGFNGVGEALKNMGDPKKFAKAMENLTPNAQKAVLAIKSVGPAWGKMQDMVQQNIFAGMANTLKSLSSTFLPLVTNGMRILSVELNKGFQILATGLKSAPVTSNLTTLFQSAAAATKPFWTGLTQIIQAMATFGGIGSTFLPGLVTGFAKLATQFNAFIQNAAKTGALKEWMQGGITATQQLWGVLKGLWDILSGIFEAATAAGGAGLASLSTGLQAIGKIVQSGPFQTGLTAFFKGIMAGSAGVMTALPAIGQLFAAMGPVIGNLASTLGPIFGTALKGIANTLTALMPAINAVVNALGVGFAPIIQVLATMLPKVGAALAPVIAMIANALGPAIASLTPAVQAVMDAFLNMVNALRPLVALLLPILIPALTFVANLLLGMVKGAIDGVTNVLKGLVTTITGVVNFVKAVFAGDWAAAWEAVKQIVAGVWEVIKGVIQVAWNIGVVGILRKGLGVLKALFTSGWQGLKTIFSNGVTGLKNLAISLWNGLKSLFSAGVAGIRNLLAGGWNAIRGAAAAGWNAIKAAVIQGAQAMVTGIRTKAGEAVTFMKGLPGKIKNALGVLNNLLLSAGENIIRGLISGIGNMAGQAVQKIKDTVGNMVNAAKSLLKIGSPSKVFADMGQWVTIGLANGIKDTAKLAEKTAATLAQTVAKSSAGMLGMPTNAVGAPTSGPRSSAPPFEPTTVRNHAPVSLSVSMTVSVDDLAKMTKVGDFIDMLEGSRVQGRKTLRSGTVNN